MIIKARNERADIKTVRIKHVYIYVLNILRQTRTVRGSDYSPVIELSEQKDKLVTATGDTEKYSENKPTKSG